MVFQLVVNGIATGSIYALVALGLTLIYNATEHVNFAQGELVMVSTFVCFTLLKKGLPFAAAIPLTVLFSILFGALIELLFIRPAMNAPHFNVFIITLGLSMALKSLAGMIWSHDEFVFPPFLPTEPIHVAGISITPLSIGMIVFSLMAMLVFYLFFKFTKLGTAMRAVCQSHLASFLVGINVYRVFSLTWVISSVLSAIAGILMAPVLLLSTEMGMVVIPAFAAAILGGWGSIPGSVVGGLLYGIIDNFAPMIFPSEIKNMIPFLVVIAVLIIKPTGIMGKRRIKKV